MRKRVAILFPAPEGSRNVVLEDTRFAETAAALRATGLDVEAAPYADQFIDDARDQLLGVDGVLVWVNPVEGEQNRALLNGLLSDIAERGVFVSAHPDVIRKMGTKAILYQTRSMPWGCDTRHYTSLEQMQAELPERLSRHGAVVLKRVRGNGGNGVWRVAPADPAATVTLTSRLHVRHAKRGSTEEEMAPEELYAICASYFEDGDGMIDQPYQARLADGMVRCYMVHDRVAGFGEQLINALHPAVPDPGERLYFPPTRPDFQPLKTMLETDWLPELCRRLDLQPHDLPIIWDADFLYGPKDAAGADTFVLCEINVSSVYPFPDDALKPIAEAASARLAVPPKT
ncbi:Cj0069 family protein [Thalassospiraceae bacterium LMO-SO8]|nr:Cj0069 family protein [Alphaproteobacteria bacterium LMO-S08]WND77034.1 Cj0069 family protein [Thalassospiraceae bacterium LMO-SO8]